MTHYAIRVTFPRTHPVIEELRSLSEEKFALGEEKGDNNLHCHVWLHTTRAEQTVRNRILRHIPKGNKSYSMTKIREPVKYLAYLIKESIQPELRGFSDDEQKCAIEYKEQVQQTQKKKTTILSEIRLLIPHIEPDISKSNEQLLMECILRYHKDNNLTIRKFQTMSYFYTLYCEQNPYNLQKLASSWTNLL